MRSYCCWGGELQGTEEPGHCSKILWHGEGQLQVYFLVTACQAHQHREQHATISLYTPRHGSVKAGPRAEDGSVGKSTHYHPDDLNYIPEPTQWKKRTESWKLSSNLHTYTIIYTHPTCTITKCKILKIYKWEPRNTIWSCDQVRTQSCNFLRDSFIDRHVKKD